MKLLIVLITTFSYVACIDFRHVSTFMIDELIDELDDPLLFSLELRDDCNMISMKDWTARRYARYVARANRYYERVINLEIDDIKMIRAYSRGVTCEFAAMSGFAQFMYRNCDKATMSIERKKAYERRFYWFTRQAYRNPVRFAKQVGPPFYDYVKDVLSESVITHAQTYVENYVNKDFESLIDRQGYLMKYADKFTSKSEVQYDRWELRKFG